MCNPADCHLSLHDALPILLSLLTMEPPSSSTGPAIETAKVALLQAIRPLEAADVIRGQYRGYRSEPGVAPRSEEHTSELQSQSNLVCRLLLEKKNIN